MKFIMEILYTVEPLIVATLGTQLSGCCIRGDRCMEGLYKFTFFYQKGWSGEVGGAQRMIHDQNKHK